METRVLLRPIERIKHRISLDRPENYRSAAIRVQTPHLLRKEQKDFLTLIIKNQFSLSHQFHQ